MIVDAHNWIQSSKSTMGNTILKCTKCSAESPVTNLDGVASCRWSWASSYSGFIDKTLKYWYIYLAYGYGPNWTQSEVKYIQVPPTMQIEYVKHLNKLKVTTKKLIQVSTTLPNHKCYPTYITKTIEEVKYYEPQASIIHALTELSM